MSLENPDQYKAYWGKEYGGRGEGVAGSARREGESSGSASRSQEDPWLALAWR